MAKKKTTKKLAKKALKKAPKKAAKKVVRKVAKKAVKKAPKKAPPKKVARKTTPAPAKPAASAAAASSLPAVGSPAPNFSLASSESKTISLADYANKTLVLYFYPKADTPGCTVEACAFRDAIAGYRDIGVDVLGVSPDPVEAVTKFAQKYNLPFPLLADTDHSVCNAYGVWVEKSMYGKKYFGAARTTFILKNGQIARIFEKVKPEGHDAEVLSALSAL